ncbi:hypothetical protein J8F10_30570 [Gemmata sp. G18]|uniref:TIGR02646 family protein n=1 Tax=Gemmata palustris TaxID=2822762 RepID=A0ABS5C0T8_9BACT|nr:hypothetical protein [Gemmata palustris]MBP3959611.1 hypothetical protein [Gemmata palustris]
MIRVVKLVAPPPVLASRGATQRQHHCDEYDAAKDDFRSGARTFTFADAIYAAEEVKDILRTAQHSKCAFCESHFTHTGYGDIEHFRPKGAYKQREADTLKYPGYYWLAYEWLNLFYSCQLCNQRFKRNLFPLKDGRSRARSHNHNLANEEPLLIDPATHNPPDYIGFREEYAFAVKGCREGEATIDVLGLNREELAENRRKRLQDLEALVRLCVLLRQEVTTNPALISELQLWEGQLQAKQQDAAEYAAMARAFLGP